MRLGFAARPRVGGKEDVHRLLRSTAAEMALDDERSEIRDARAPGTGDARPVGYEEAVRDGTVAGELICEVLDMVPAHTAPEALHQAGSGEHEAARAHAYQRDTGVGRAPEVFQERGIHVSPGMQQAADHDDIVEGLRR
jgi:hypothetical protein